MDELTTNEKESLLEFPCRFPIKVMGRVQANFKSHVLDLIGTHVGKIAAEDVTVRASSQGNYLALTVNVTVQNREQLDDVYRTLTASELILYVI